ncbi:unnamed protein product [Musa acuminata subsp. burmannicoides]
MSDCHLFLVKTLFSNFTSFIFYITLVKHNVRNSGNEDEVDFRGGNVHVITSKSDWEQKIAEANKDGKIVVANFSATWCSPCRMVAPVYSELSEKYPSLIFLTIDVDNLMDFCWSWDISATPTFFFLKDGQQLDKLIGANGPELEHKIRLLDQPCQAPTDATLPLR